jgi:hypothetical protein
MALKRFAFLIGLSALNLASCGADIRRDDDGSGGTTSTTSTSPSGAGGEGAKDAAELVAQTCPDVASEAHYCITLTYDGELYALGPDTGNTCLLGRLDEPVGKPSSIAVEGPHVHGCDLELGLWRASVLGGALEWINVGCEAVTSYQDGFLLMSAVGDDNLSHYATFEAIEEGAPLATYALDGLFSRFTTRADTLYAAWHSTDVIERHDLLTESLEGELELSGFDDWVWGMSATEDGRIYVLSREDILAFDLESGAELSVNQAGLLSASALHCWSN